VATIVSSLLRLLVTFFESLCMSHTCVHMIIETIDLLGLLFAFICTHSGTVRTKFDGFLDVVSGKAQ